jgi:aerobic carbon-monoxide dehydrogenase medium subunit
MQVPAPFQYERATSVEHALTLLSQLRAGGVDTRILAGGHSLLPMMKLRLATPEHLIDIDGLAGELGYICEEPGVGARRRETEIRIGAMTRHRELLQSPLLARRAPIFTDAERVIADPVVRNRGTIGGALCQADPSEDLSAVCAAVGARLVIRGLDGERIVDMDEFHQGPYRTCVADDEMLIEIRIPAPARAGSAYEKVDRRAGDWAVAAAGASLVLVDDGVVAAAGIGLAAVGAGVSCSHAQASLVGGPATDDAIERAAAIAAEQESDPVTDQRGSAEYKRHVAGVLVTRALRRARARAPENG